MSNLGDISSFINENWHGGQIEGDFFDHPEMQIEENNEIEKKSNKLIWNWKHVITRELMRGKHKYEILSKYKTIIDRFDIKDVVSKFLDKNDGVLGYFIIDVSNFDENFTYDDIPQELKSCNLYAINAIELIQVINRSLISQSDGSFDGYLNSDETIDEQVYYFDNYTGLPCIECWNGQSDDQDSRLDKISQMFVGRKWMTISEKQKFDDMQGKLPYLVSIVKRTFALKSHSNNKFDDDINNFNIVDEQLEADSISSIKDIEVNNIRENKIDDIGNTSMPKKVDIKREFKKSDFKQDVDFNKKIKDLEVNNIRENKIDDIGNTSMPKKVNIEREFKKSDFKQDVKFDDYDKLISFQVENYKDMPDEQFELKSVSKGQIDIDQMFYNESDKNQIVFDDMSEFIIDDIKDMKDDQFDYNKTFDGEVDIDQMFVQQSDKNDVDIDNKIKKIEISNKYDWSW